MKNLLFIFCFLAANLLGVAQEEIAKLTPKAEISLITCGPGEDLYSVFGHSALRVNDPGLNIDAVFNYGTFHFSDDFYAKFTMGKLNYMLSVSLFPGFYKAYVRENRQLIEQVLDLNPTQKQALFEILIINNKPENRVYLYDFFYNNCSTKLRDKLEEAVGENVVFDTNPEEENRSFRQMLDFYLLPAMDWSDFGIDLALGLPCDKKPSNYEDMFLPDELMIAFDKAKIIDNGTTKPLVKTTQILYERVPLESARFPWFFRPFFLAWLFFFIGLGIAAYEFFKKKDFLFFDRILFGVFGLFGLFLMFLWFVTDHTATAWNLNVIWVHPLMFFTGFLAFKEKQHPLLKWFFLAVALWNIVLVAIWGFLPQMLHYAAIPLALLIAVRCFIRFYKARWINTNIEIK